MESEISGCAWAECDYANYCRIRHEMRQSMIQWATVLFYFSVEEVLISSVFSEYGGAKILNARIFLFYRRCVADFCFAPPYGKNQKVDRFIKRLQRKIKLFLDIYLLRFSSSPGRVNVPSDFDTIEKAFSGGKTAEKGIKQGLSRSNADFGSPCLLYSVIDLCRSKVRRHRGMQALWCTDFGIIKRFNPPLRYPQFP